MVRKSKFRRRTAFINFYSSFDFNRYKQKSSVSEKRDGNNHIWKAAWHFCLVSYGLTASFPRFFITPSQYEHLPRRYLYYSGIYQWLFNTLSKLPMDYPITLVSKQLSYTLLAVSSRCPIVIKSIFQQLLAKLTNFCPFPSKQCIHNP
jgi:hypothetical protein